MEWWWSYYSSTVGLFVQVCWVSLLVVIGRRGAAAAGDDSKPHEGRAIINAATSPSVHTPSRRTCTPLFCSHPAASASPAAANPSSQSLPSKKKEEDVVCDCVCGFDHGFGLILQKPLSFFPLFYPLCPLSLQVGPSCTGKEKVFQGLTFSRCSVILFRQRTCFDVVMFVGQRSICVVCLEMARQGSCVTFVCAGCMP